MHGWNVINCNIRMKDRNPKPVMQDYHWRDFDKLFSLYFCFPISLIFLFLSHIYLFLRFFFHWLNIRTCLFIFLHRFVHPFFFLSLFFDTNDDSPQCNRCDRCNHDFVHRLQLARLYLIHRCEYASIEMIGQSLWLRKRLAYIGDVERWIWRWKPAPRVAIKFYQA